MLHRQHFFATGILLTGILALVSVCDLNFSPASASDTSSAREGVMRDPESPSAHPGGGAAGNSATVSPDLVGVSTKAGAATVLGLDAKPVGYPATPGFTHAVDADSQPDDLRTKVRSFREAHEREILKQFVDLLSIPNIASDSPNIQKNARLIASMLEARGVRT
ncbi:MAG: hypothetical protein ACREDR_09285, partial [Blastocatellia bacterium]